MESALFHYGYSDFSPREWSIDVPLTSLCEGYESVGFSSLFFHTGSVSKSRNTAVCHTHADNLLIAQLF